MKHPNGRESRLLTVTLFACVAMSAAVGSPQLPKRFLRKRAIVCRETAQIVNIAGAKNSLRHFAQIRSHLSRGWCQSYGHRISFVKTGATAHISSFDLIEVRTEDKPDEIRWTLTSDVSEHVH